MVTYSSQELIEEDQMKTAVIKKILGCQINPKKTLLRVGKFPEVVYHFNKSFKLFTQYTSYEVPYIAKSSTPK